MENVLAVYKRPYDPKHPVVCFDEKSKQLVGETRVPIPASAGEPERHDYEYVRNGTANLFLFVEQEFLRMFHFRFLPECLPLPLPVSN
jgi:hypothetical protein